MSHFDLLLILASALASARIAVLIVHDVIIEKQRDWFFRHFPPFDNDMLGFKYQSMDVNGDDLPLTEDGQRVFRRGWWFAELLTCTRCLTVWTTVPTYIVASEVPHGDTVVAVIAAMAIASWVAKKL